MDRTNLIHQAPVRPIQLLLIERDPSAAKFVRHGLNSPLVRLTRVDDAAGAEAKLRRRRFDAVLCSNEREEPQSLISLAAAEPSVPLIWLESSNRAPCEPVSADPPAPWPPRTLEAFMDAVPRSEVANRTLMNSLRRAIERKRTEMRMRSTYDHSPAILLTVDSLGVICAINRFGAQVLGFKPDELHDTVVYSLIPKENRAEAKERLRDCVTRPEEVHRWECAVLNASGEHRWLRIAAQVNLDEKERTLILLGGEDITDSHARSEQLRFKAKHDALTGLVNREEFEHRLGRVVEGMVDTESEHALCYLDLDQFKLINDSCGHLAGDELLRQLAGLLKSRVRKRDTLARLGGDEFAVLMEHCSLRHARRVANALWRAVNEFEFAWEDKRFRVGVSIGLISLDAMCTSPTKMLAAADRACYEAKGSGRNKVYVGDSLSPSEVCLAPVSRVDRIREALVDNAFELHYQPIRALAKPQQGQHCELLIRMRDEENRWLKPGAFLPVAERYRLATQIDRWVVSRAVAWIAELREGNAPSPDLCFINLSGQSLDDEDFPEFVAGQIEDAGVPAHQLCFEITETAAVTNLTDAARMMTELKAKGCRFALDDFGSGLSSFAYLKTLPVDYLKIDGVFVRDMRDNPVGEALVRAINEIGQVMGKQTIAEFVEDEATVQHLKRLKVDFIQGFAVGRPRAIHRFRVEPQS